MHPKKQQGSMVNIISLMVSMRRKRKTKSCSSKTHCCQNLGVLCFCEFVESRPSLILAHVDGFWGKIGSGVGCRSPKSPNSWRKVNRSTRVAHARWWHCGRLSRRVRGEVDGQGSQMTTHDQVVFGLAAQIVNQGHYKALCGRSAGPSWAPKLARTAGLRYFLRLLVRVGTALTFGLWLMAA